jgi:transcriptional regulator with PAS, ATPase and Fis domain
MSRESEISPACLPLQVLYPETPAAATAHEVDLAATRDLHTKRREREHRAITEALIKHEGNLGAVAAELGISRVSLWRKRKKYT